MRRLFLLLLVAVLPLRAAAGDLIALAMVALPGAAATAVAMPADCEMHRAGPAGTQEAPVSPADAAQCECCSLCLPVAQAAAFPPLQLPDLPEAHPRRGEVRFASALAAPRFKPPTR